MQVLFLYFFNYLAQQWHRAEFTGPVWKKIYYNRKFCFNY